MSIKRLLGELAFIRSGCLFRSSIENDPEGQVFIIQLRDVSNDGFILTERLARIKEKNFRTEEFLKKDDVIFKAKSNNRVATVFKGDQQKAIVTIHYFIIRLKSDAVTPDFLAWSLNQKPSQEYFETHARGTRMPIINKEALANLEIFIPDLAMQKRIIDLHKLSLKEKILLEEIKYKRSVLLEGQLSELINKKSPG